MRQILVIANETVESDVLHNVLPQSAHVLIVAVTGTVGDADPLQAIVDALPCFRADAIVIATHPPGRSNWLARDLVARARRRFDRPIVHVVVDAAGGREYVREAA